MIYGLTMCETHKFHWLSYNTYKHLLASTKHKGYKFQPAKLHLHNRAHLGVAFVCSLPMLATVKLLAARLLSILMARSQQQQHIRDLKNNWQLTSDDRSHTTTTEQQGQTKHRQLLPINQISLFPPKLLAQFACV